jgi:hypothetical protein
MQITGANNYKNIHAKNLFHAKIGLLIDRVVAGLMHWRRQSTTFAL